MIFFFFFFEAEEWLVVFNSSQSFFLFSNQFKGFKKQSIWLIDRNLRGIVTLGFNESRCNSNQEMIPHSPEF